MRYPLNRPRVRVGFAFGDPWEVPGAKPPYKMHTGEDDQASAGEPVFAPADGVVYNHTHDSTWGNGVVMEFDSGGEGCCIWHVDHLVADGAHVIEGQQIATIYDLQGNTHMHLSFWVGDYDANLKTGALPSSVWPDRFVEPDRYLDSHPGLPHSGHPPITEEIEDMSTRQMGYSWPDGHEEVFRISGGTLQHIWDDAKTQQWTKWQDLTADARCRNVSTIDAILKNGTTIDVIVTKVDLSTWHFRFDPGSDGTGWHGWQIGD